MIQQAQCLYDILIQELQECKKKNGDIQRYIECGFSKGYRKLQELGRLFNKEKFRDITEEIQFYKHLLPQFRGLVEYYALVYAGETCQKNTDEEQSFWLEEKEIAERYIIRNATMYDYYKSGDTKDDTQYFTMTANDPAERGMFDATYEKNNTPVAKLAKLIARERYINYIGQKLNGN